MPSSHAHLVAFSLSFIIMGLFDLLGSVMPQPWVVNVDMFAVGFALLLGFMVGVVLYLYAPSWKVSKVPGPRALPLLGHVHLLAKYGPDVLSHLAHQYGPIFRFQMGRQPLVIIASPELCKEVGIKKFKDIPNRSIPSPIASSPLHQKGLFFTK